MINLAVFASLAALLWLMAEIVGLRGLRGQWLLLSYLVAQFGFTALSWLGSYRFATSLPEYRMIYGLSAILPIATALLLVIRWMSFLNFDSALTAICCAIVLPCGASTALLSYEHTPAVHLHMVIASAFCAFGLVSIFAALGAKNLAETNVVLLLALFWLVEAAYLYGMAASAVNINLAWVPQYAWFAPVAAIVIFSLLAWKLSRGQFEGSRESFHMALQHVHDAAVSVRSMVR